MSNFVQCLVKQGFPEGMVLTAIKRSIKGQAQEIVLHMGKDATVNDIITRFDMMFGNVNPPHVLLAQYYSASQVPGESITDWYARLEDIASKITRKDGNVMSPNNYDILVNTQFWTKMCDERRKNALQHKFDELGGSPQFIVEARKIEMHGSAGGWSDNSVKNSHNLANAVVGKANEVSLFVSGRQVLKLLDTGLMVSTMSHSLCSLLNLSIQPLDKVFQIKGAGGHEIPYLGIAEATICCSKVNMTCILVVLY